MFRELEGQCVIITGAAGGIGAAAVKGFAERGVRISAIYNKKEPADDIANLADWYQCDLSNKQVVYTVFTKIGEQYQGLDALVNIAGLWRESAEDIDDDHIDFMVDVNLKSAIYSNQAAFQLMKNKGGRIVNFGSVEGVAGNPRSPVYAACKGAVHAWTRSAALRWAPYSVCVNTVAPAMHTPGFEYSLSQLSPEQQKQIHSRLRTIIPLGGEMGDPLRDCVPLLAFLASEGSRFITGQLISVDGGLRMLGA